MFTFTPTSAVKTSSSYARDDKEAGHDIWKNFDWLPGRLDYTNSITNNIKIRYQKLPASRLLTVSADDIEDGGRSYKTSITLSEKIDKNSYKVLGQAKIDGSEQLYPMEITASKSGEIYGIALSNADQNYYLLGWDRQGNRKYTRLLHQRRTPTNPFIDEHNYSSIDHDNERNIYITGFFSDYEYGRGYETHVYIEKRNAKTGNLIWRSTPFAEQINGSIRNGTHPTLLTTDGKVLVSGSGYFWIDKSKDPNLDNDDNGTYIAKLDPRSGRKLDQIKISDNTNYLTEFATRGENVYFSTDNESFILDGIKAASSGNELWDFTSTPKNMGERNKVQIGKPNKFKVHSTDKITNFNPSIDTLEIDADSFGIDSSATFASGKNGKAVKKKLAKQDIDFLYDEKKGGLYFNENGSAIGFGEGGIIAILKGAPELTASNLDFI